MHNLITPQHWQQVKRIFQSVLEYPPDQRAAFLDEACASDPSLRSEIESLISSHDQAGDSIEAMAGGVAAQMLADDQGSSFIGRDIGHYQIVSHIGKGGMGDVFLAQDLHLDRHVALKLLPREFAQDADRLRRFQREARAVSALNHPNILTIHEVGQIDSINFIVAEFIEGKTLRSHMRRERLTVREALGIAIQIANALAAAHKARIVHRDVKPENIMLREDGIAKVLDFGLAKLTQRQSKTSDTEAATAANLTTDPGIMMGTVNYMSPEQARGRDVDERTDIFSLGVLVYEMITGKRPYEGETNSDVIASLLTKEPAPIASQDGEVPAELERIVRKCLEKDCENRYRSAQEVLDDLERLRRDLDSGVAVALAEISKPSLKAFITRRLFVLFIIAASMVAVTIYLIAYRGAHAGALPEIKSLAVLPLEDLSGDSAQNNLADGMTEALINNLSRINALRVISPTSVRRYKGTQKSPPEIASEIKVDALVEGKVLYSGGLVRIAVKLIHAPTGRQLWTGSYERDLRDVMALQQDVARTIAAEINIGLTPPEQSRLANARPINLDAYDSYLKGQVYLRKRNEESLRAAINHFEEAIAKDQDFPLPYFGMADAYFALGTVNIGALLPEDALAKAQAAALKAVELDDTLAEAHTIAGVVRFYSWQWSAAEESFKRAVELNPSYAPAHSWYALYLAARGRLGEAIARMYRARELDPLSPHISQNVGWILHMARQYDEEIEQYQRTFELDPDFLFARMRLAGAYLEKRMFSEAISEGQKAIELVGRNPALLGWLGHSYALSGKKNEARQILEELLKLRERRYVNPASLAVIYVGLGLKEQAFRWLEECYQERSYVMVYLKVEQMYDPIRSDPRFQDLLRRVGLTQ